MYAVFVNDGFDSLFKVKEQAKLYAKKMRANGNRAFVHKLTKQECKDLNCTS